MNLTGVLTTFEGYTVDMSQREFRTTSPDVTIKYILFNSPESKIWLEELKSLVEEVISFENRR